jgi:hypothetical protein
MEAWDGQPPPDASLGWGEANEEVEFFSTSGEVRLWALTGGGSPSSLVIGPAGWAYRLRVHSTGRDEALALHLSGSLVPARTERYLLLFWPDHVAPRQDLSGSA